MATGSPPPHYYPIQDILCKIKYKPEECMPALHDLFVSFLRFKGCNMGVRYHPPYTYHNSSLLTLICSLTSQTTPPPQKKHRHYLSNPQLILHLLSPQNYQIPVSFVPGTPLNPSPQCSSQDTNTLPSPSPQSRENLKRPTRRWPHSQCRSPVPS